MAVRPIPEGYSTITPYLIVSDAAKAIDFYARAFGAQELMRFADPGGKIMHAELQIGDSRIMLADEAPQMGYRSPLALGGSATSIMLYVNDVDQVFNRAIGAGAQTQQALKNQFYGDRSGTVIDPFGHVWTIATHVEDVSEEEMRRRMDDLQVDHPERPQPDQPQLGILEGHRVASAPFQVRKDLQIDHIDLCPQRAVQGPGQAGHFRQDGDIAGFQRVASGAEGPYGFALVKENAGLAFPHGQLGPVLDFPGAIFGDPVHQLGTGFIKPFDVFQKYQIVVAHGFTLLRFSPIAGRLAPS